MRDDRRRELTPREAYRQRRKDQIQRRRLVAALVLLGLIVVIIVLVATCGGGEDGQTTTTGGTTTTTLGAAEFAAELTGDDTEATGAFTMTYDPDTDTLSYELTLDELDSPTGANIYEIEEDDSGTVVYVIYADDAESGPYTGRLADGDIDETSLTGSLEGRTVADLIQLIRDGRAYVGVGTADTPVDAIRGDLLETTDGTDTTDTTDENADTTETTDEDTDTTDTTDEDSE